MITFDPVQQTFRLDSENSTQLLVVNPLGGLGHLYWGASLPPDEEKKLSGKWQALTRDTGPNANLELMRRDFADFGHNDLRCPAFVLEQADGSRVTEFKYFSHEIIQGKPPFPGLAASAAGPEDGVQTLLITLGDKPTGLELDLFCTLDPAKTSSSGAAACATGEPKAMQIQKFASLGLDLGGRIPPREFRRRLGAGAHVPGKAPPVGHGAAWKAAGACPPHDMNPFVMVAKGAADEEKGEVYGLALSYSGNWLLEAEVNHLGWLRLNMGLNDFAFSWLLEPGGVFTAPECVTAYSASGYGTYQPDLPPFHTRPGPPRPLEPPGKAPAHQQLGGHFISIYP